MDTVGDSQPPPVFKPTSAQEERAAKIRRFNLLVVYLPIGLLSVIVVAIVIFLLIYTLTPLGQANDFIVAAFADVIVIVYSVPLMIICAILPVVFVLLSVQSRQRGIAPIRQTQSFLWRVEQELSVVQEKAHEIALIIAKPFIALNSFYSYVRTIFSRFANKLKRR